MAMLARTTSHLTRLTLLALVVAAAFGCNTKNAKAPGVQPATPVAPAGYAVSVTSNRSGLIADDPNFATITVKAFKVPEWTPVPNLTTATVTTSLGALDNSSGAATLSLELFNGSGTTRLYPGSAEGLARVRAEVNGAVDIVDVNIRPAPEPGVDKVATTIVLTATPGTVSDGVGGTQYVTLTALVRDQFGNPLKGASVNFSSPLGSLFSAGGSIKTNSNGEAFDTLGLSQTELQNYAGDSFDATAIVGIPGGSKSATFPIGVGHP